EMAAEQVGTRCGPRRDRARVGREAVVHPRVTAEEVNGGPQGERRHEPGRVLGVMVLVRGQEGGRDVQGAPPAAEETQQRDGDPASAPGSVPRATILHTTGGRASIAVSIRLEAALRLQ